jgi:hypothetical protein
VLRALIEPRLRLLAQEREIAALREELAQLRAQVESMRTGMRRCLNCDYRIAFKTVQHRAEGALDAADARPSTGET